MVEDKNIQQAEHEIASGVSKTVIGIPCAVIGTKLLLDAIQGGFHFQSDFIVAVYEQGKFIIPALLVGFGIIDTAKGTNEAIRGHTRLVGAQTAKFINSLQNKETPQS